MRRPSGENTALETTFAWPLSVASGSPVATSHRDRSFVDQTCPTVRSDIAERTLGRG
jgi:hypothetical protein